METEQSGVYKRIVRGKESKYWYIRFTHCGRPYRWSSKKTEYIKAAKILDDIQEAGDGVVICSRSARHGYGKYIKIRHADGTITLYGHLSKRFAHYGDRVKAGESIGVIGNTGESTGRHCHFSVIDRNGKNVDPLLYLETNTLYY